MLSDRTITGITKHIANHIGDPANVLHELIPQDLHIDIHIVSPTPKRNYFTLVTTGMCELAMKAPPEMRDYRFAELMICLAPEWPLSPKDQEADNPDGEDDDRYSWPLFWLRTLARAPHEHGIWIGENHTIPNGDPPEPLGDGTELCCVMFRSPLTTPRDFATLALPKKTIRFLALVPIYRDEMQLALETEMGHEDLAARLDATGVTELLNPGRPSVCSRK
jgi:hypothetical protein